VVKTALQRVRTDLGGLLDGSINRDSASKEFETRMDLQLIVT